MRAAPLLAFTALLILGFAAPGWADKPDHAGGGKGQKESGPPGKGGGGGNKGQSQGRSSGGGGGGGGGGGNVNVDIRFGGSDRVHVRDYFTAESGRGCPPGLAKKNNGCMPPGQAKKWSIGRPLPRDVVFYELPAALIVKLTPPPAGHRYVRAAADILLIAVGTGMVIDAIEDLGRL